MLIKKNEKCNLREIKNVSAKTSISFSSAGHAPFQEAVTACFLCLVTPFPYLTRPGKEKVLLSKVTCCFAAQHRLLCPCFAARAPLLFMPCLRSWQGQGNGGRALDAKQGAVLNLGTILAQTGRYKNFN
jgi:hypothetical protein